MKKLEALVPPGKTCMWRINEHDGITCTKITKTTPLIKNNNTDGSSISINRQYKFKINSSDGI